MSNAVSPQPTPRPTDLLPVPLLPRPAAAVPGGPAQAGDPRFQHAGLLRRVFTAAGEVEAAEWGLDQVLDDAATSCEEVGLGFDVAPVDGALESARWTLDQAVSTLHEELRAAARHGVPLALLCEASALEARELRPVLEVPEPPAGPGAPVTGRPGAAVLAGELTPAV